MSTKILFITDPVSTLNIDKDTSLFMVEHAQSMDMISYQCETSNIYFHENKVKASTCKITSHGKNITTSTAKEEIELQEFKFVFMRKDPPVDQNYMNTLHLLDLAESHGAKVINSPEAVKKFNEKIFALYFSQYIPETIITAKLFDIKSFMQTHAEIVIKPLDGMGGESIYKLNKISAEEEGIVNDLTDQGTRTIVAQKFLPEIYDGDFRILIIHGKPFHKTLARMPQNGSFKGNLAAGGIGVAQDLKPHQESVANEIGKVLLEHGLVFAGLDMIGEKVTEINVTSPTCAREIFEQTGADPIKELFSSL